jgi:hypothetical protein
VGVVGGWTGRAVAGGCGAGPARAALSSVGQPVLMGVVVINLVALMLPDGPAAAFGAVRGLGVVGGRLGG